MEEAGVNMATSWRSLTPDVMRNIASRLDPNEAAAALKLVSSETEAALRDSYNIIKVGREGSCDGHALGPTFLAHWSRPDPWRSLSHAKRLRLLHLAASSHHPAALDVALEYADVGLSSVVVANVMAVAAGAGDLVACQRLLEESCDDEGLDGSAACAAARGGHLSILHWAVETGASTDHATIGKLALAACEGGQGHVLTWLEGLVPPPPAASRDGNASVGGKGGAAGQAADWDFEDVFFHHRARYHRGGESEDEEEEEEQEGERPSGAAPGAALSTCQLPEWASISIFTSMLKAAASGGHAHMLQRLLDPCGPYAELLQKRRWRKVESGTRLQILYAMAAACPEETLRRCYSKLALMSLRSPAAQPANPDATDDEDAGGQRWPVRKAASRPPSWHGLLEEERLQQQARLVCRAVFSATPDWKAKASFLVAKLNQPRQPKQPRRTWADSSCLGSHRAAAGVSLSRVMRGGAAAAGGAGGSTGGGERGVAGGSAGCSSAGDSAGSGTAGDSAGGGTGGGADGSVAGGVKGCTAEDAPLTMSTALREEVMRLLWNHEMQEVVARVPDACTRWRWLVALGLPETPEKQGHWWHWQIAKAAAAAGNVTALDELLSPWRQRMEAEEAAALLWDKASSARALELGLAAVGGGHVPVLALLRERFGPDVLQSRCLWQAAAKHSVEVLPFLILNEVASESSAGGDAPGAEGPAGGKVGAHGAGLPAVLSSDEDSGSEEVEMGGGGGGRGNDTQREWKGIMRDAAWNGAGLPVLLHIHERHGVAPGLMDAAKSGDVEALEWTASLHMAQQMRDQEQEREPANKDAANFGWCRCSVRASDWLRDLVMKGKFAVADWFLCRGLVKPELARRRGRPSSAAAAAAASAAMAAASGGAWQGASLSLLQLTALLPDMHETAKEAEKHDAERWIECFVRYWGSRLLRPPPPPPLRLGVGQAPVKVKTTDGAAGEGAAGEGPAGVGGDAVTATAVNPRQSSGVAGPVNSSNGAPHGVSTSSRANPGKVQGKDRSSGAAAAAAGLTAAPMDSAAAAKLWAELVWYAEELALPQPGVCHVHWLRRMRVKAAEAALQQLRGQHAPAPPQAAAPTSAAAAAAPAAPAYGEQGAGTALAGTKRRRSSTGAEPPLPPPAAVAAAGLNVELAVVERELARARAELLKDPPQEHIQRARARARKAMGGQAQLLLFHQREHRSSGSDSESSGA